MWNRLRNWYDGEAVVYEPPLIGFTMRRHWTASAARVLVEFWQRHWQWIIGTGIAIVASVAAVAALWAR